MALVLIALAGISLAGLARRSLQTAGRAAAAQEELQRRWGELSARQALLARAEQLLQLASHRESQSQTPAANTNRWPRPASVSAEFVLGKLRFSVLLADEDAKANLNTLYRDKPTTARQAATEAAEVAGAAQLTIRTPAPTTTRQQPSATVFQTWGQVFDLAAAHDVNENAGQTALLGLCDATTNITCWGSGRLNLRRASDQAVRAVCRTVLSTATLRKLLAQRRTAEPADLNDFLQPLALKSRERAALLRLLTERSRCYSLWIDIVGPHRNWTRLTVDHPGPGLATDRLTFAW